MSETKTKKVKAADVPAAQVVPVSGANIQAPTGQRTVDAAKVAELEVKWDQISDKLSKSIYVATMSRELALHFRDVVVESFSWKGPQCLIVEKIFEKLDACIDGQTTPEISIDFDHDLLEVLTVLINSYVSHGKTNTISFSKITEILSVPVQELQNNRKALREVSMELEAARQGMSLEDFILKMQEAQRQQSQHQ
jgi:hypothetical protein